MQSRPHPGLKVLLVEDNLGDAELLVHTLRQSYPDCATQTVATVAALEQALGGFEPDVILSDGGLPSFSLLDALRLTQARRPDCPFFLVAGAYHPVIAACLKQGAADFIPKTELARLPPAIATALEERAPLRRLSQRQLEVVRLLAAGNSMRAIARELHLSLKTVESHRSEAMKRLGLHDLAGLVRYAIRVGMVSPNT